MYWFLIYIFSSYIISVVMSVAVECPYSVKIFTLHVKVKLSPS